MQVIFKKKYSLLAFLVIVTLCVPAFALVANAADPDFGGISQFHDKWVAQDHLVGSAGIDRPYTWGPGVPGAPTTLSESYANSPGGTRRVLYLDKARMELNNPGVGYVTTGLAVKELVSGMRQDGDTLFTTLTPSRTQVAGDAVSVNPNAPVYASFYNLVTLGNADSKSKPSAIGSLVNQFVDKGGNVSAIAAPEAISIGSYQAQTGHNIAAPFEAFKNIHGSVTDPTTNATLTDQAVYTTDPTSNVFGLAISEPYWVNTKVGGIDRTVLVQLFERRVLTYNPALPGSSLQKVEMGNLGQHYYQWRYVESVGTPSTTTPVATTPGTTTPVATTPVTTTPVATTPVATTPATTPTSNFAGTWYTNFAIVGLTQSGTTVTGNYQRYGEAVTYSINGTVTGNTLNGTYFTYASGPLTFVISADGSSFTGSWGSGHQWCGVKTGPLPAGCGFSNTYNTNFSTMNLTQTGSTVVGSYRRYGESLDIAIHGTVNGTSGTPVLNGYYGTITSNTLNFNLTSDANGFDGSWLSLHQWCGVHSGALPAGCGWSGKWNLGGAGTVANLVQDGSSVTGTYVNGNNGTVAGTVTTWTLNGTWHINGLSGPFKWTQVNLSANPTRFQGNYNATFAWCGYRDGTTAPTPCYLA